jgi:hypothetical protein
VALWLPPGLDALRPFVSPYKGLSMALQVPDARVVEERSSPLGLLTLVESPTIPFRHAPGLSLNNLSEPPPQLGLFTDADSLTPSLASTATSSRWPISTSPTTAAPYHLLPEPETLILGAGGGEQVLLALYHGAPRIDAVELNPQVIDLVADDHADFAGNLYAHPGGRGACGGGTQLRRPQRPDLRPDPDAAPHLVRRGGGGHPEPARKLRLHG